MSSDRTPSSPPQIEPLAESTPRPLWSIMIPTYNCAKYLTETLQSVLVQDTGVDNMQIEVVDDCSTDENVEHLVQKIGKGRVKFYRHEENVGSLRNFEACITRSTGHFIHLLHGDDQVVPGFYTEIETLFKRFPSAGAAFSNFIAVNESGSVLYRNNLIQDDPGIVESWLMKIAGDQCLQTCGMVVKRSVYEQLGSFFGVHFGEDWEMWVRIAAKYPVAYTPLNLALYRTHPGNISMRNLYSGKNVEDIKKVIGIIQGYLPAEKRKALKKTAEKNFSIYFANNAWRVYKTYGQSRFALKQAKDALFLNFNSKTFLSLIKLFIKVTLKI